MEIAPLNSQPSAPVSSPPVPNQPFLHALLFLKKMVQEALEQSSEQTDTLLSDTAAYSLTTTSLPSDTLAFGNFYATDLKQLKAQGHLQEDIKERRAELLLQKEEWRSFIEKEKKGRNREFYAYIDQVIDAGKLIPNSAGCGGSYFFADARGNPYLVVKPGDEDALCLNNRKKIGSPFNDREHRVRDDIPLYHSVQREAFCWELAELAGLEEATPPTVMHILSKEEFYDITQNLHEETKEKFIAETQMADQEKLCSVQEFVHHSQDLSSLLHTFYAAGLSDQEIASRFDPSHFEQVCLFLWLTYDSDGHGGNFLAYVKHIDRKGKKIYGLKKIDNALSFPEKNTQYLDLLAWMPNATVPPSLDLQYKILGLPVPKILERMDAYGLSTSKEAFKERLDVLYQLAFREGITLGEIDLRMGFLSHPNGKQLAVSPLSTQEILKLVLNESPFYYNNPTLPVAS